MKELISFIKEIDSNNSQNFKIEKLKDILKYKKYEDFIRFVYSDINFYLTEDAFKGSTYSIEPIDERIDTLESLYDILINLSERKFNFRQIEDFVCFRMDNDTRDLFFKCLKHNLFVGVSNKVLEKAWKEMENKDTFLPIYPYMRCSLMDKLKHIKYPAYSQVKMDGTYSNIIIEMNKKIENINNDINIKIYSRQGKLLEIGDVLIKRLKNYVKEIIHPLYNFEDTDKIKIVLMGEALVKGDDGKPLDRKTGNGLITSLSKQFTTTKTYEDKMKKSKSTKLMTELRNKLEEWDNTERNIYFVVWDILTYDKWQLKDTNIPDYTSRLSCISFYSCEVLDKRYEDEVIKAIATKEVNSYEEAYEHFQLLYSRGEEGTILKNKDLDWKNGTSNFQIKFKAVKECELKVIGYEIGSGKYSEGIGALLCESSDGLLKVSISGLTEAERGLERADINDASKGLKVIDDFDFNKYTGKIITVEFNELIQNKTDEKTYSLFLPRIKEFREDKTEADSLDYIKGL